ncbi:uncharacterized protein ColSpa_04610 [Colletotrichum spaethianum]|uniref:Uncharacterized protein n=1 Tax=Colletotrichum spaethianum TaxID=700344 RepID=A0AA37LDB3_9PEZI|nr:uncharacterized protein ColSpa_04610 [Colletotrichum spaethianum]GKT44429.1 hypothetical protein ColSpa_04610 [Colletotrichum spaethianum]
MSEIKLSSNSAPLGGWVDELFNKIFFQPNDILSHEAFKEHTASDLLVRVKDSMNVQSNNEIQVWNAPDGSGGGCVAHMWHLILTEKTSRQTVKSSSLTLANVQIRDGKRVLVELTEVAK